MTIIGFVTLTRHSWNVMLISLNDALTHAVNTCWISRNFNFKLGAHN